MVTITSFRGGLASTLSMPIEVVWIQRRPTIERMTSATAGLYVELLTRAASAPAAFARNSSTVRALTNSICWEAVISDSSWRSVGLMKPIIRMDHP